MTDRVMPPVQSKLIIDRARWLRGEGSKASRLLRRDDGKMCCLGFYALTCGFTEKEITERSAPALGDGWPGWMFGRLMYGADTIHLMEYNDGRTGTEAEREGHIAAIFAKNGVTVEFIGDAAEPTP